MKQVNKEKVILVAEDDDISYLLIEEALLSSNVKLIRAENGEKAVELCKSNKDINLVLMDVRLPGLDGNEATKQIKKVRRELPVIVETAHVNDGEREKSFSAGCDDYITKPIRIDKFLLLIEKYININ